MIRHPIWPKRAAAALAAAALAICGLAPAQAQGWSPNEDDQLLLELRSGQYRLGDPLRGYQTAGAGICVDMADLIQALNLPIRLDKKSRRATGWIFAESETIAIDRDSYTVQTVNESGRLGAQDLYDTPEGWCADLGALSRWLGVTFRPELSNLAVVIESKRKLPFLEAIERKSRAARLRPGADNFDLSGLPRHDLPYRDWRAPAVDVVASTTWRQSAGGRSQRDFRLEAYASGEIFGASYDARLSTDASGVPDSLRLKAYRIDPAGEMLGPLKAVQVAGGDVETFAGALTGQSAVGRGLFVSNRPVTHASRFAETNLRGELPAGWDAELYRNGQLLAFQADRGNGRYEFGQVDLRLGDNNFEVVLYGPQGQIRRERTSYPVTAESVPAGQIQYWAGILQQDRDLIDFSGAFANPLTGWRWGVGVERGIDKRTSLGIGAQSLILGGRRRTYVETTLRRGLGPMLVELAGAQELGRSSGRAVSGQMLGRIGRLNIRADAFWAFGGYESEVITAEQSHEFGATFDYELRFGRMHLPLQAGMRRSVARDGSKVNEILMRASLVMRGLSLTTELSDRRTSGPKADQRNDGMRLRLLANTRLGDVRLRGNARFRLTGQDKGFEYAELNAEKPLGPRSDIAARVEYEKGSGKYDFGLGLVRQFDRFSLRADGKVSSRGDLGLGLSLAMSLGPDPVRGGWRVSSNKLAQFGSAAVTVFRDENGDGVRQRGEEPIEGVEIVTGGALQQTKTDASGRVLVDGLRPFREVLVSIDLSSIEDPLLVPKGKGVVLVPRPGIPAQLELALSPTGEVEGTLLDSAGEQRSGVTLELVDAGGQVAASTRTEFDGYFLFDRVPYGDYRVRLGKASAEAIGARGELGTQIRIDRKTPTARIGQLRLEGAMRIAAGVAR